MKASMRRVISLLRLSAKTHNDGPKAEVARKTAISIAMRHNIISTPEEIDTIDTDFSIDEIELSIPDVGEVHREWACRWKRAVAWKADLSVGVGLR